MEQTFCSRIWRLSDNIDTDIIIMSKYLAKPSLREMVPHLFEPLRPELAARLRPGDAIVAGENFGCGSSREMAASVLKTAGIRCIIAKSFAKIDRGGTHGGGLRRAAGCAGAAVPPGRCR